MEKNSRVGSGNAAYDGTRDQDVKEAFNEALANNGLCILPISIEEEAQVSRWEEETNYGVKQKQSVFTKVKTKYLLLHESGESIELAGYGHGVDAQDKGAGKALTYALKNTLLYSFLTPVGKIEDTDTTHSNDVQTPKTSAPKKTDNEKIAIKLSANPDDKWFEVPFPSGKKPHAGKTLGDVAADQDTKALKAVLDFIDPCVLEYPLAVERIKSAIAESQSEPEGAKQ